MGNCQAIDAAALVIQHPCGKLERMYWSISASEVMKMNPGHYVSLIIPLPDDGEEKAADDKTVRFTRVKLLRPTDTLVLGHAYRLVTSQDVMKVLRAKKYAKMKNKLETDPQKIHSSCREPEEMSCKSKDPTDQATRNERQQQRSAANLAAARSKSWRPSLQSISEAAS